MAEVEAIQRAALLAGEAGAKLHIVHISSGSGVAAALEARARGVDISIETCPHYLYFTEEDMLRSAPSPSARRRCAARASASAVRRRLLRGEIDIVGSDHSPAPLGDETRRGFLRASGAASRECNPRSACCCSLPLERMAAVAAANPAARFGIARKGAIAVGNDADFALLDLTPATR